MIVAVEGIDGSGKSTLIRLLRSRLAESGVEAVFDSEPYSAKTFYAENDLRSMSPYAAIMAFRDNRKAHWPEQRRFLEKGSPVLVLDRSLFSSFAYQSFRGPMWQQILKLHGPDPVLPHEVIWLDVDVETALRRLDARSQEERGTYEHLEHLEWASKTYRTLSKYAIIQWGPNGVGARSVNWTRIEAQDERTTLLEAEAAIHRALRDFGA